MSPRRILWTLAALHVAVIIASNVLVQIPLELGPVLTTWGSFTFPIIFLATDLSVRVLGKDVARRVVLLAMGPALLATYVVSVLFQEGAFAGWAALGEFNLGIAAAMSIIYFLMTLLVCWLFYTLTMKGETAK